MISDVGIESGTRLTAHGIVNRTLKGDRLPPAPAFHPNALKRPLETNAPRESVPDSKLPDGCESLVSSLANIQLARIAGRCVSQVSELHKRLRILVQRRTETTSAQQPTQLSGSVRL